MIEGLRPYADMVETGLPWLPSLPVHWDVRRNGRLFGERRETGYPDLPVLEVSIRTGVRVRDFEGGTRKQEIADRSKYQRAVQGDIAYNMMRMWQGAVGIAPADGLVSPAYVVAKPFAYVVAAYYAYLFRTDGYKHEIDAFSRGIVPDRNRLYWEAFKQMPSAYPPLEEQRLIVGFLDWHGGMTARLIRAKKRLIALLNEQKQSIIHHAVTRGLDPATPLKPSGVDWLGDVPEGWEVRKLGHLFQLHGSGTTPSGDVYYGDDVDWVVTGNLRDGTIEKSTRRVSQRAIDELSALRVYPAGSLLVAMYGATIGRTGILTSPACTNQACCVLALPRSIANVEYLQMFVNHARPALLEQSYGGGQPNINAEVVKKLRVPLPPVAEQMAILQFVRNSSESLAIETAQREITLIQEFRTRLIADVVTGQLDVRALAATLPAVTAAAPLGEPDDDAFDEDAEALEDEEADA